MYRKDPNLKEKIVPRGKNITLIKDSPYYTPGRK
jgi:hypothetical protein